MITVGLLARPLADDVLLRALWSALTVLVLLE